MKVMLRPLAQTAVVTLALGATLCIATRASAQMIIKNPGDHVSSVELEPHLVLRPLSTPHHDVGLGLGFRATVPIVSNGFISTINNSVGIGFGLDYMRYDACGSGGFDNYYYDCGKLNHFSIPVVMQWNFFLSEGWSVFGEPGLAYNIYSYSKDNCGAVLRNGNRYDYCPSYNALDPVFFAGARWHFAHYTTLTMRLGWPYWSVGVSFL